MPSQDTHERPRECGFWRGRVDWPISAPLMASSEVDFPAVYPGKNAANCGVGTDAAFANANDCPSLAPQALRDLGVAPSVRLDFLAPEFPVGAGQVFARAAMPETPIYKYGDLQPWPCEIRATGYWPLLTISAQARRP